MGGDGARGRSARWSLARRLALGIAAGCLAGIPQVLAAQFMGAVNGRRERADIGPRFVQRVARLAGRSPSRPQRWSAAALFHFAYAAGWGAVYAALSEFAGLGRVPPLLAGGLFGVPIYAVAFSRFGAATVAGTERHPERRDGREWAVQLSSALAFALTLAYSYRRLRGRV